MKLVRLLAVGGTSAMLLFACAGEDEFDPAAAAERGIHDQIYTELEMESEVTCEEPSSLAVGTRFTCRAKAEDGTSYEFVAEILENQVIGTRLT